MMRLLQAEFAKIKGKGFWLLSFVGAFGVIAMQMVNYGVRKEWLLSLSEDDWSYFLLNVQGFVPISIVLGIAILATQITSIEDDTNAWKQQLALPISKKGLYAAKFITVAFFLALASVLLAIFTYLYGSTMGFKQSVPYNELLKQTLLPTITALPILALQLWLGAVSKSPAVPITVGVVQFLLTYSAFTMPKWMPWTWLYLPNPTLNIALGLGVGIVIFIMGMYDFYRKDAL